VVQADAWVHGHLDVQPVTSDADWAKLETVTLATAARCRAGA
jgi:hypothetical protein